MDKPSYILICNDKLLGYDLHSILAYEFNPKLAEITDKYYIVSDRKRPLNTWINAIDGARVEILYDDSSDALTNLVIDAIYRLRDLYSRSIIDLDAFRRQLGSIAYTAYNHDEAFYSDLRELLRTLGCMIHIGSMNMEYDASMYEKLEMLRGKSEDHTHQDGYVQVTIMLRKNTHPWPQKNIRITNIVPMEEGIRKHSFSLTTNSLGIVTVRAQKYTILEIKVDNNKYNVMLEDKNLKIEINTWAREKKHRKTNIIRVALLLIVLLIIILHLAG